MPGKPILIPGPDHPISVERYPGKVMVRLGDVTIAESSESIALREADYPPVYYIPLRHVDLTLLEPTAHHSYCPYKGEASYLSVTSGGPRLENAVWRYERPYDAVSAIAGHLAFYPDRFEISVQ